MSPVARHFPVMKDEVIKYLINNKNGFYVDCTFGQGGHSEEILKNLGVGGRLLALDVDKDSIEIGKKLEELDSRFSITKLNFEKVSDYVNENNLPKIDGIIFDLGISTTQLNDVEKGFSYKLEDSFLDMRMNREISTTASDVLNHYPRNALSRMFKQNADIKDPSKLVNNISAYRKTCGGINTCGDFKRIIEKSIPKTGNLSKFMKQCFQALRIEINDELNVLSRALNSLHEIMKKGGIIVIITFHSLEEKILNEWKKKFCDTIQIHDYAHNLINQFSALSVNRCLVPSELEVSQNWSSRSSKLWIMKKN